MLINCIFSSIQGEGPKAGIPMTFIRMQGCNQRCPYCDTKETWDSSGINVDVNEIVSKIPTNSYDIYITGGEPLQQDKEVRQLILKLRENIYRVITVATNGTLPRPLWWRRVLWDVDCKCPSSGINDFHDSWKSIGRKNNLKFVVSDQNDLQFVVDMIPKLRGSLCPTLLVSPVILLDPLRNNNWFQEVWNFCIRYNLRYSHQIHKVVWEDKKGV